MKRLAVCLATATLGMASLIGSASADTVWRYPFKGMPYAVSHDHGQPSNVKSSDRAFRASDTDKRHCYR